MEPMTSSLELNIFINCVMEWQKISWDEIAVRREDKKAKFIQHLRGETDKYRFVYGDLYNKRIEIESAVMDKLNNPKECLKFETIWQFCQFVKYAEKTKFYHNDISQNLYVDSDLYDMDSRVFIIKDEHDYQLAFKLEKREGPNKEKIKIINLTVSRFYGRKMNNVFIIVNENVKYNDESDKYLIDSVNEILYRKMNEYFKRIISLYRIKRNTDWIEVTRN